MMVLKRSVQLTILVLLAASFKFGWNYLQSGGLFPISVVKVEADYTHLSQEELQTAISSDLPASFWTVDILSLKNRLQASAWVQSVDIQKVWPETLKVRVNEKKIMARWGKDGLLSDKEQIFYPENQSLPNGSEQLPILYGPTEQVKNVVKQYNIIQEMLRAKGMAIKMLYMSKSGAWSIRLTNGTMLLLGRDDPLKRLTRFLHAYDSIFTNQPEDGQIRFAQRVDLRYPHGMAISWAVEPVNKNKDSSSEDK